MSGIKSFFGTWSFYKKVIILTIPMMIQNGITQFVNMVDNLMIGQVGTAEMSGVSIANQLIFVFNLCIFGALSGAGIFGAQFFGSKNIKGLRDTFRFKILMGLVLGAIGIFVLTFFSEGLISIYLRGEGKPEEIAAALNFGKGYLLIMSVGFIPFAISQCFASTLRETGKATAPMVTSFLAVGVNLALNYILIFGNFGAPKMGVAGAAVATVISRFCELFAIAIYCFATRNKNTFMKGAFRSFKIPASLVLDIIKKATPLMLSETLWSAGLAFLNQRYSVRGYAVVPATNISSTFFNLFSVAIISLSCAIGILMGQQLGAGGEKTALDSSKKLITFATLVGVVIGLALWVSADFIPDLYKVDGSVKELATIFMKILAIIIPFDAMVTASYFIMRSGGKTMITLIFDAGSMWGMSVLSAYILSRFTSLPIIPLFAVVQFFFLVKAFIGVLIVRRGKWIVNMVSESNT